MFGDFFVIVGCWVVVQKFVELGMMVYLYWFDMWLIFFLIINFINFKFGFVGYFIDYFYFFCFLREYDFYGNNLLILKGFEVYFQLLQGIVVKFIVYIYIGNFNVVFGMFLCDDVVVVIMY